MSGAAWREACERLAAMGEEILGDGWPDDEQGRVEGVRHLATQVACWFTYATGHSDPERPAFFRSADPTYAWGGPNVDQVARRAAVDGAGMYRVSGRMGSCEEFILQIKGGAVQSGGAEIATEVSASSLGLGPATRSRSCSAARSSRARGCRSAPGPGFVHVRDYYFDWVAAEPATFVIERLDTQGTSAPAVSAAPRRRRCSRPRSTRWSTRACTSATCRRACAPRRTPTSSASPTSRAAACRTSSTATASCRSATTRRWCSSSIRAPPRCGASARTRPRGTSRSTTRPASPAATTARSSADADGLVRVVLAGADTGTANWLDTAGRPELLTTVRWFRPPEPPPIRSEIVPLATLDDHLPDDHPRVDPEARADELRGRAAHVSWRYRT